MIVVTCAVRVLRARNSYRILTTLIMLARVVSSWSRRATLYVAMSHLVRGVIKSSSSIEVVMNCDATSVRSRCHVWAVIGAGLKLVLIEYRATGKGRINRVYRRARDDGILRLVQLSHRKRLEYGGRGILKEDVVQKGLGIAKALAA